MKILVTGANGYLGQGITKQLLDLGNDVIATDFFLDNVDDRAEKIECDLFQVKDPYQFFSNPDAILHLAWKDGFSHYADYHIFNLKNHYKFIRDMAEAHISKIIVMGSMHEVGFFEGSINEKTICNPITPYGIGKNALRQLVKMLCEQKKIVFQWLRGFYIVGNTEKGSSIFSKITIAEREGKKLFPFTKGLNQYDFIDYEDFCEQVAYTASQDEINGIINICSGRPEKIADRVERFIRENNYNISLQYGAYPDRPYDSKAVWGDDSKIKMIMSNIK